MVVVTGIVPPLIDQEEPQPVEGLDNPHTRMAREINATTAKMVGSHFAWHSLTTRTPNAAVGVRDVTDDKASLILRDKAEL